MVKQKVITVNINIYEKDVNISERNYAHEVKDVNKYLEQGWVIKDAIKCDNTINWVNITFILQKSGGTVGVSTL